MEDEKFQFSVGDLVRMKDTPLEVKVLFTKDCEDGCPPGTQVIGFRDPQSGARDEEHSEEFELVEKSSLG